MNLIDVYADREKSIRFLYELLEERQREPEYGISFKMPTMQQHRKFVCSKPYRYWYIVTGLGDAWVGAVNCTDRNEIGIHVAVPHRGFGYGTKAVAELIDRHKPLAAIPSVRAGCWLANVSPANERSARMFEHLGFKLRQRTYALEPL